MTLRFKEKGLPFEVSVDETLPETIVHDEERLFQIATNLVGNAIKFTDEGKVSLSFNRAHDRLIIKVSDTGIGIPTAKQQIIFDEFVQVVSSSTRSFGGAGLGLSIVKQLTILMRGNVGVTSVVGEGATFTVDLPLNLVDTQKTKSTQSLEMNAQGA
jgi:signal transduction histidine kinase